MNSTEQRSDQTATFIRTEDDAVVTVTFRDSTPGEALGVVWQHYNYPAYVRLSLGWES